MAGRTGYLIRVPHEWPPDLARKNSSVARKYAWRLVDFHGVDLFHGMLFMSREEARNMAWKHGDRVGNHVDAAVVAKMHFKGITG